jgi:hypothetical protein
VPAGPRRNYNRLVGGAAVDLTAREIDDVAGKCYDFLNHCFLLSLV